MPDIIFQLHADRDACIGSGLCVSRDPDVFDQDDAGIVHLHTPTGALTLSDVAD